MPIEDKYSRTFSTFSSTPIIDGKPGKTSVATVMSSELRGQKSWVRTPDFAVRKKLNSLPVNGFTNWSSILRAPYGTMTAFSIYYPESQKTINTGILSSYGGEADLWAPSASLIDALDRKMTAKLRSTIKDQKVNIAQAMAEHKQTAALIGTTIVRFVDALRNIRHGDLASAAKVFGAKASRRKLAKFQKEYAERILGVDVSRYRKDPRRFRPLDEAPFSDFIGKWWLELQYGWKPLLSDIYGLAEHIAKQTHGAPMVRASVRGVSPHEDQISYMDADFKRQKSVSGRVRITYGCRFRLENSFLRESAQLGFSNPLLLAWELLPYSFVVDWFIPIGNWLQSMDATSGLVFVDGYRNVKIDYQTQFRTTGRAIGGYGYQGQSLSTLRYQSFSRTALGAFPGVQHPSFKNPLGVEHVLNALALLKGAFRK